MGGWVGVLIGEEQSAYLCVCAWACIVRDLVTFSDDLLQGCPCDIDSNDVTPHQH